MLTCTVRHPINAMIKEDLFDNCYTLNTDLELPFTKSEYDFTLNNIKLKSAPGLDQIDFKIVSAFPDCYVDVLLHIYNHILNNGVFPQQ